MKKEIRILIGIGICFILTILSCVLQFLEFSIPIVPSFIKFDLSYIPALIASFAYTPIAGIAISLIKNIVHLMVSTTGFVAEISDFITCGVFILIAGVFTLKKKSIGNTLLFGLIAAMITSIVAIPLNYFVVLPMYERIMGFPQEAFLGMYQAVNPSIKSLFQGVIIYNGLFTFIKCVLVTIIGSLLFVPIKILHQNLKKDDNKNNIYQSFVSSSKTNNADKLLEYKELLDIGAITQEEFDAKKKELLG